MFLPSIIRPSDSVNLLNTILVFDPVAGTVVGLSDVVGGEENDCNAFFESIIRPSGNANAGDGGIETMLLSPSVMVAVVVVLFVAIVLSTALCVSD